VTVGKVSTIPPQGTKIVYIKRVKGIQPMRTTTKAQALSQFRYNWKVSTLQNPTIKNDSVAKSEAWGIFTDELCREGYITMKKYESWSNPF